MFYKSTKITFKSVLLLSLSSTLFSCQKNNLPKYNELQNLRVLALVADKPEVDAGTQVTITPIVSDLLETTQLQFTAVACIDPGLALGADPSCDKAVTKDIINLTTITTLTTAKAFTGAANSFSFTVPDSTQMLTPFPTYQRYNGVSYIIQYDLSNTRGDKVRAIKRILVTDTSKTPKNNNPIINNVLFNDSAVTTTMPLAQSVTTTLSIDSNSKETYQRMTSSGEFQSLTEELVTTWFITDGTMKYMRTIDSTPNTFDTPGIDPTTHPYFIIAITRDGRGGVGYRIQCFGSCL